MNSVFDLQVFVDRKELSQYLVEWRGYILDECMGWFL